MSKWVWLLTDSKGFGGIESHILALASGLLSHEIKVRVILLSDYDHQSLLIPQLERQCIPYTALNRQYSSEDSKQDATKKYAKSNLLGRLAQLWQQTKDKPDVIHSHGYKASLLIRAAKALSIVPKDLVVATTFHAGETPTGRVRFYDWLDRYTAFLSPIRIAVSRPIQNKIPVTSQRVNNFVADAPLSKGEKIAFVGRLSHEKGPDRYLQLAQQIPHCEFHLFGSGPMEEVLEGEATHNVQFHGHQVDMEPVWAQIGLLVLTSRFEGLPMSALEAMVRGIPVISFAVGEIPSLIVNGKNGWIVDDIPTMAIQIEAYLNSSASERQAIKQYARTTIIDHYSYQAVIPQLLQLYFGRLDPAPRLQ
ncbi:glycosyltransferase family 4 protein [Vibrio hippocampi]|uniref:Glycosyltransferase subfamily 4-like N-terminal domain-containing protein n=1 Tax=Vibrio hippocampi TaxID=654686 RepID=A0ABN8DPF2_9VIBR|nr:glycosyltransferase family 4 protein [Vibrio hippocampi]CAH0529963.1 hypothetical protein VHP8226_03689 [Vibrio hippocampi]